MHGKHKCMKNVWIYKYAGGAAEKRWIMKRKFGRNIVVRQKAGEIKG